MEWRVNLSNGFPQDYLLDTFTVLFQQISTLPRFTTHLNTFHVIQKLTAQDPLTSWTYQFPQFTDDDNDVVTMSINLGTASSFIVYDGVDKIKINDLSDANLIAGSYQITVTLHDGTNNVATHIDIIINPPVPSAVVSV